MAIRGGSRSGRRLLTGHLLVRADCPGEPARVGFVVSRAVGGAVTRNAVRRRLRHLARGYLDSLPPGSLLVVRANPPAAAARQADLAAELDLVLGTLLRRQLGVLQQ
jgi:ribonuclease P protein component